MTHLSMEALLALRNPGREPGDQAAGEHLAGCAHCRDELERLHQRVARLRALPSLRPGRDRWPAVAAVVRAERRRRVRWAGLGGLAAAASAALAVGLGSVTPSPQPEADQLRVAMERSRALETALDHYNPDARVLDGRTGRVAQELEDRIAEVDRALEMAELGGREPADDSLLRLWRERVGLLDALVDVHLTRASYAGL